MQGKINLKKLMTQFSSEADFDEIAVISMEVNIDENDAIFFRSER